MPSPIEIFKAGTHTAMNGQTLAFSEADLQATVNAYDPAVHEAPLVVGHPRADLPAYGWVKGLAYAERSILAEPDQVDTAFAELVREGRFKKVSASFYTPNAPGNPVPGVYYLRHVGFLGAQPPAVKGLKSASFAAGEAEEGVILFAEMDMPEENDEPPKKGVSMKVKNRAQFCADCEEHVCTDCCPTGAIAMSADKGAVIDPAKCTVCGKCCEACCMMQGPVMGMRLASYAETLKGKDEQITAMTAERDAAAQELARLKTDQRRAEFAAFCDSEEMRAKISPAMKPTVVALMMKLDGADPVEFGEGDDKVVKSALEVYQDELRAGPDVVRFGEQATKARAEDHPRQKATAADFGEHVDEGRLELHNRVLDYQEANPGTSYDQALAQVQKDQ